MTHGPLLSRRHVLQGALIAGAFAVLPFGAPTTAFAVDADPFAVARQRWVESLIGSSTLDRTNSAVASRLAAIATTARGLLTTYVTTVGRTGLWANQPLQPRVTNADSQRLTNTVRNLRSIALARTAGVLTAAESDRALQILTDGLTWLNSDVYATTVDRYGNWYDWDIATPQALNDTLVLVYADLPAALRDSLLAASRAISPTIPTTGTQAAAANLVLICDAFNGRGILSADSATLIASRDALASTLKYAEPFGGPVGLVDGNADEAAFFSNDGFYPDGSFIQHGQFPYVGGYGASFLSSITAIGARTGGTDWCPDLGIVVDWMRQAFEPWLWRGLVMDTVRGRGLDQVAGDQGTGTGFISGMIALIAGTSGAARDHLRATVKEELGWRGADPTAGLGLPQTGAAVDILNDASLAPRGPLQGTWVFGPMDRVLHRRTDWAVAVAMNSLRMADYETGGNQNLRGWYQSDAATYLYTADQDQYDDAFWCTVDSARLPGTTVDTVTRQAEAVAWRAEYHNPSYWAGGVTAGTWGAATIDLTAKAPSTLHARQSRFFFDDCYVAIGSAISVAVGRTAETIIENRRVTATSSGPLVIDGASVVGPGETKTFARPGWAHIDGVGGYVLLEDATVMALREQRSGRLSDISGSVTGATATTVHTGEYLTLAIEHGAATDGWYAYAVLPGVDSAVTASFSTMPEVRVVERSSSIHAVRHELSGRFAAAFFAAGASSFVRTDTPCAVAIEEDDETLTIHVSDPAQTATAVTIALDIHAASIVSADPRVRVAIAPDGTTLTVAVAGLVGGSVPVVLAWKAPKGGDLSAAVGQVIGHDVTAGDGAGWRRVLGQYLDAVSAGQPALALDRLRAFQALVDAWLAVNPGVASVIAIADLASRLVARTV